MTDGEGLARLRIDTTRFARSDSELAIEARVVDASRREVIGRGSLRVTRRPWFVFLHPERRVHRLGDVVRVDVRAEDANQQPVAIEGAVTITRERWREIWLDPSGRQVSGDELAKLRAELMSFPPPHRRGERPWRLHTRGYQPEVVLTRELRTDENGSAELRFEVEQEGFALGTGRVTYEGSELVKDFTLLRHGGIRGQVRGRNGQGVGGVTVQVVERQQGGGVRPQAAALVGGLPVGLEHVIADEV